MLNTVLVRLGMLMQASAEHLLSAAIMSAPAALAMAKLSYPETEESHTKTQEDVYIENLYVSCSYCCANTHICVTEKFLLYVLLSVNIVCLLVCALLTALSIPYSQTTWNSVPGYVRTVFQNASSPSFLVRLS